MWLTNDIVRTTVMTRPSITTSYLSVNALSLHQQLLYPPTLTTRITVDPVTIQRAPLVLSNSETTQVDGANISDVIYKQRIFT